MSEKKTGLIARISRYFLVIILLIAFAGIATYAALSDNSIHGLTVKFYNISWSCPSNSTYQYGILTYKLGSVVVYSSSSLTTSLSHVTFGMSTGGIQVGTSTAPNASFEPGQSVSYNISFANSALSSGSLPLTQQIALTITATVSAGLYISQVAASDSETFHLSSLSCPSS